MFHSRRGQMFSTDFIASAFIFFLILSIAAVSWNMAYEERNKFSETKVMKERAFQMTDLLVRTPGYPENWNSSTVEIIGLAEPDHVIQQDKVQEMSSLGYSNAKSTMRMDRYEFFLNITSRDYSRTIGDEPGKNSENVVVERRTVIMNTTNIFQRGTLEFILWR